MALTAKLDELAAHGNQRSEWDVGCRSDFPNPDYRW
jgi:hypothetical protein